MYYRTSSVNIKDDDTGSMKSINLDNSDQRKPLLPTNVVCGTSDNSKRRRKSKLWREGLSNITLLVILTISIGYVFGQIFSVSDEVERLQQPRNGARGLNKDEDENPTLPDEDAAEEAQHRAKEMEEEDDEDKVDFWDKDGNFVLPPDIGQRMREWFAKKQLSEGYFFSPAEDPKLGMKPYGAQQIVNTLPHFTRELLLVMYIAETDEFSVLLPGKAEDGKPKCEGGCKRIWNIMRSILFAFRNRFPARFQKGSSQDLLFLVSTAESPALSQECYERPGSCGRRRRGIFAPILHFGSSFGDETELQSLVVMPPPPRVHLRCMAEWQMYHNVCPFLMPKTVKEDGSETPGLVFGEHINYNEDAEQKKKTKEGEVEELTWGDLVPQVVWRGADLPYLTQQHPTMRSPDFKADVEAKFDQSGHGLLQMLRSLRDVYNDLRPRWKAIVLTAEAEFDANNANANPKRKQKVVPWANMKFSSRADPDLDSQSRWRHQDKAEYAEWTQVGIPAWGGPYTVEQMAKFKYHLDLGGGQGTSWSGTMQKLALPGVLFHHNTGTVDWFHEHLVPWIH